MELIKGQSAKVQATVYSYWSGQAATSVLANLVGATIKTYIKERESDADSAALLTINGTVTDGPNGLCESAITAAQTNTLSFTRLVIETVAKLAGGDYIRSGVEPLILLPNVGKTLF
jgi:hypothetical protein